MRRLYLCVLIVVVLAALLLGVWSIGAQREWTTCSDAAYSAFLRGVAAEKRFRYEEAERQFLRAVELDPEFAMAHLRLGGVYLFLGEDEWRRELEIALGLSDRVSERERLLIQLAEARVEGAAARVEELLSRLERRYPRTPEPKLVRAELLWDARRYQEAAEQYQELLRIDPNYAMAYNHLGYLYLSMERYDEAIDSFKRCIFISPGQANPHDSLGECYLDLGRYDEAIAQFRQALAAGYEEGDWRSFLGSTINGHLVQAYLGKGEYERALAATELAAGLEDGGPFESYRLGLRATALLELGRYDEALEVIEQGLAVDPESEGLLSIQARLGAIIEDPELARRALVRYQEVRAAAAEEGGAAAFGDPDEDESAEGEVELLDSADGERGLRPVHFRAAVLLAEGRPAEAAGLLERALKPSHRRYWLLPLWSELILAHMRAGQLDRAAEVIAIVQARNPRHARIRDLARALEQPRALVSVGR
jgi:superkiller protein 3